MILENVYNGKILFIIFYKLKFLKSSDDVMNGCKRCKEKEDGCEECLEGF